MDAPATTVAPTMNDLPADTTTLTVTPTAAPIIPTAAQVSTIECHICICINTRKPTWKQPGPSKMCLLCVRQYCTAHAAPADKVGGRMCARLIMRHITGSMK
ncbi:hypothetical protein VE02_04620 [Pseudogymnoascus sp. 03VT05]|nr:hypothetical protein VE02_04620 [Pseudogymnoascus sp. 03VT05]